MEITRSLKISSFGLLQLVFTSALGLTEPCLAKTSASQLLDASHQDDKLAGRTSLEPLMLKLYHTSLDVVSVTLCQLCMQSKAGRGSLATPCLLEAGRVAGRVAELLEGYVIHPIKQSRQPTSAGGARAFMKSIDIRSAALLRSSGSDSTLCASSRSPAARY